MKSNPTPSPHYRLIRFLLVACALVLLVGLFSRRGEELGPDLSEIATSERQDGGSSKEASAHRFSRGTTRPAASAEEIVAAKVGQFAQNRRIIAQRIADRLSRKMPADVEAFFAAVEAGRWDEIKARWEVLAKHSGQYANHEATEGTAPYAKPGSQDDLNPYWQAVLDAYGVAEQAHGWPAQKLLDYGNAVLDSLRPGMVYVGGTDSGRWIPELLNETSGGEQHVILTQNALADGRYGDWLRELYGERLATFSAEDSQRVFEEYTADARKRLEHDQQFPDEPKQVRPGEDIKLADGRLQISGQTAVMSINERLLQFLMVKNPDLSFAIQESFPLKGTYADAIPLGPLMELSAQEPFTQERAAQSIDYWRVQSQNVLADPEAVGSPSALKSYSHDAVSAANLLAARGFTAEAEQGYRIGLQLWSGNSESTLGLVNLLHSTGRTEEARRIMDAFAQQHPDSKLDEARAVLRGPKPDKP